MELTSASITNGEPIPSKYAMGKPDPETHATFSDNVNPELSWSDVPEGTGSFAVIVHDTEVPTKPDDVNQEGRTVPIDLPRTTYYHWLLANIPADVRQIPEGLHSNGVTYGGKDGPDAPQAAVHGINNYREWFAGDPQMGGDYYGYDGPFPPWNDERVHSYVFTVYALDVDRLELPPDFDGPALREALEGHVLAKAQLVAPYKINPAVSY